MSRLPRLMHRTFSPRVIKLDGGFAGLFQLDFTSRIFKRGYKDPVLVACTDGVGTKLRVARLTEKHDTVGIDLVAMSVNDAICCGAEPLFFLDYVAMSHDDPDLLEQIVLGISNGCLAADCTLLGGETAIMPDMYAPGDYDLAGFCVGVVERRQVIDGSAIEVGDVVIGIGSSGVHSNGYSLVRRVVFDMAGLGVNDHVPELGQTVGESLLTPTAIYSRPVRRILSHYTRKNVIKGIAHITGGGLFDNLLRIVPDGVRIEIQPESWDIPPVFTWLQLLGDIDDEEMSQVFNMGIGMVLVVRPFFADSVQRMLSEAGLTSWRIGKAGRGKKTIAWAK
jgi:phosphoribosylformylglycinamidine cyclo-ligase